MVNLKKAMETALAEQAYICYKFGWNAAQIEGNPKLSRREFFAQLKKIVSDGKDISDGFDPDRLVKGVT